MTETRKIANRLLDRLKDGDTASRRMIDWALRTTGDLERGESAGTKPDGEKVETGQHTTVDGCASISHP